MLYLTLDSGDSFSRKIGAMPKVFVISCRDAGVDCDFKARGATLDEVMQLCADHAIQEHKMQGFGPDLYLKMRRCVQVVNESQ